MFENSLEWLENDLEKWYRIVWLYKFWSGINSWGLKYCIEIWKVEKKKINKKVEKNKKIKWNEMSEMRAKQV